MKLYLKILNEIYPFKIHVFLGYQTIAEIKSKVKAKKKVDTKLIQDYLDTLDWENSQGYAPECRGWIFVLVKSFNGTPKCYDTLHHEITHAVDESAEYIGMESNKGSREYFSYMHGFITRKIYEAINKHNGKRND